jgi:hypothetical protein
MDKPIGIFLRAHTECETPLNPRRSGLKAVSSSWPEFVLVLDTETTTDARQALTVGVFRFCRAIGERYVCIEEGLFYADELEDLQGDGLAILRHYASQHIAETPDG